MAQGKGLLAFFKKSSAVDRGKQEKTNGSANSTTPSRVIVGSKRTSGDNGEEREAEEKEFLPTIKSKKRRFIIESDEEGEAENHSEPCENDKGVGEEDRDMDVDEKRNGEGMANGMKKEADPVETMDVDKSSGRSNGVVDSEVEASSDDKCAPRDAVAATPPRRRTARKHTGKVWSSPRNSIAANKSDKAEQLTAPTRSLYAEGSTTRQKAGPVSSSVAKEPTVNKEARDHNKKKKAKKEAASNKEVKGGAQKSLTKCSSKDEPAHVSRTSPPPAKAHKVATSEITPTNSQPCNAEKKKGKEDVLFNPAQANYHPVEDAIWQQGQKVPYLALARTFELIEEESKRLKIIATLTNFFRSVLLLSPEEMVQCVYLCLNKLAPAYEGLELGIGESILVKAIAEATGRNVKQIKSDAVTKGDLGKVAEASRSSQRMMFAPPKLTISGVFTKLKSIATMTGNSSMAKKVNVIKGMFTACRHSEARYLIRSLGGKLRIGLAEQSVLVAIARAAVRSPPGQEIVDAGKGSHSDQFQKQLEEATLTVKTCYCEHPNYDVLVPALISHGVSDLHLHCHLTAGIPLKPMLAHPTKGIQEVLQRFESADFTCEWKYDGERAQIHVLDGGEIRVYSRNSENNTSKYPDIIARMPRVLKEGVSSCIIDSEVVAWDVDKQQILPFQILSTRKRKDAEVAEIKVQVCVYAFDLLFINGKSMVREPLKVRREALRDSFNEIEGEFKIATSMDTTNIEEIQEFLDDSIKGNCEGLMVKTLEKNATYEIARRSHNWLKLKKDYLEGVGDTLDLVVVGGFHGTGKRTGRYGGFLLACYDEDSEEFQVICKIGTGFKDEDLETHTSFFKAHVLESPKPYFRYSEGVRPDHWFEPVQVWEVKAADLSISPVYLAAAGIVDPEKGISLRFPRFLRVREDKKPEEATNSQQVATLYRKQQNINKASGDAADPEEFY